MSDLERYVDRREERDGECAREYEAGYESFRIGEFLRQARIESGLTPEELARELQTKKTAVSRIENHVEGIRLSTLEKYARALNKRLRLTIQ